MLIDQLLCLLLAVTATAHAGDELALRGDFGLDDGELAIACALLEAVLDVSFPLEDLLPQIVTLGDLRYLYETRRANERMR